MINLIQGTARLILEDYRTQGKDASVCGVLNAPDSGYDIQKVLDLGMVWAADNGCFLRYEPEKIIKLLRKSAGLPDCLFFAAPDVVRNHEGTLKLFWQWEPIIASYGYPVAFVVQNGATIENIPWESLDAIFIGGDDTFKYSDTVDAILIEAGRLGKWRHFGRLSTFGRWNWFVGHCDSFDSSGFSRWRTAMIAEHVKWMNKPYTKRMALP